MPALPYNKWAKLPASQRGNWSYQKYRSWVGRTEMKRQFRSKLASQGQTYDPYFAPTNAAALQKMAHNIVGANTLPLIQALQKQIEAQRKSGSAEINANTAQLVKSWAPFAGDVSKVYGGAIGQEQDVMKTLSDYVKNAGQQGAASLQGAGAQAGASPEAQAANAALAQTGAGAAAATAGMGSSDLTRLIADKANEVSYAASLPGRARDMGAWNLAALTRQLDQQLASGTADIQGKVPGMVSDVMQQLMNRELEKATARQGFSMDTLKAKATAAGKTDTGLRASSTATGGGKWLRDAYGNIMYDANGNPIPNVPKAGAGGSGGLSPTAAANKHRQVMKQAGVIASTLYAQLQKKLFPGGTSPIGKAVTPPLTGKQRQAVLEYGRHNVTNAVMGYLKQQYPGQSAGWYRSNAATVLEGQGWHIPAARLRKPGVSGSAGSAKGVLGAAKQLGQFPAAALGSAGGTRAPVAAPGATPKNTQVVVTDRYGVPPAQAKLAADTQRAARYYRKAGYPGAQAVPLLMHWVKNQYRKRGLGSLTDDQAARIAREAARRAGIIRGMQ